VGSPDPEQYDAFADAYETHAADAPYNALYDRPATLALLGPVDGRRVLDAACGPGFYLEELVAGGADVVVCALAYHYLNDRPGFLAEARRILAPTGALVISTHHPTDDWCRLGGSYFEVDTVTETWSRGWDVTAWRLPLTRLTEEFAAAGFLIERLVEPLPQPEMARTHPGPFEKLSRQPAFILFRLRPTP